MTGEPSPGSDADPVLARFLAAWHRLSDADRLRLVDEGERLLAQLPQPLT